MLTEIAFAQKYSTNTVKYHYNITCTNNSIIGKTIVHICHIQWRNYSKIFLKSKLKRELNERYQLVQHVKKLLKLQSISFASLSLSLFENLELHLIVELSFVLWHGSSADESNVLRSMFGCQSTHWCRYCTWESQILANVLEYMTQIRIFTIYCHLKK